MSEQAGHTEEINLRSKPRPRASLPRFCDEMEDKLQQGRQIRRSSRSPKSLNKSREYSRSPSPNSLTESDFEDESEVEETPNESRKPQPPVLNQSTSGNSPITKLVLIAIIIAVIFMVIPKANEKTVEYRKNLSKEEVLKYITEEIRQIKKEFKNQENEIWLEIFSEIKEIIFNPMKPSIFILFSDKNDPMSCLASTISELGRMALGSNKNLVLKPDQLNTDTGEVIETLRFTIPKRKSVIFWDLLSMNDGALKAFHNICDRENPLVKEAIYVITVKTDGYSRSENPLQFIENKLKSNFSGRIDEDAIQPLITRITDGPIISVKPELDLSCRFKNKILY